MGADFDDKTLSTCEPCYSGPPPTEGIGPCAGGCLEGDACAGEVTPAIESCSTIEVDESCDGTPRCDGATGFGRGDGDATDQDNSFVAVDPDDNILLAADAHGLVDYGGGNIGAAIPGYSVHLVKLGPAGEHLWSKSFSGGTDHHVGGVVAGPGGEILLGGHFAGGIDLGGGPIASAGEADVYVAKLDAAGALTWGKTFGDALTQVATDIALDAGGDVIVGGYFNGSLTFGPDALASDGGLDAFVAKLNPAGTALWGRRFGDASDQHITGVAVGPGGEIAITGYFNGTLDFGGGSHTVGDGGVDGFVAVLGPDGAYRWSHSIDPGGASHAVDAAFDARGRLLVTGYFQGTPDFGGQQLTSAGAEDAFLVAYDEDGTIVWARGYGDGASQIGASVTVDAAGYVVVGGYGAGSIDFGAGAGPVSGDVDAFVAKLDPTGDPIWSRVFLAPGGEQVTRSVTTAAFGDVVASGWFAGSIPLAGTPIASQGLKDTWVARLRP